MPLDVGRHAGIESRSGAGRERPGRVDRKAEDSRGGRCDASLRRRDSRDGPARGGAEADSLFQLPAAAGHRSAPAGVEFAADHAAAARAAFSFGRPVLLTTGTRNLAPYAAESRRTGVPLVVRVLERPASLAACRQAGIPDERILAGRGPFSVEENRRHIRAFGIGVLVTKDSGRPAASAEKLDAARAENCRIVAVRRPELGDTSAVNNVADLLRALREITPQITPDYRGPPG